VSAVEALAPVCLSGFSVVACCHAGIGDDEEVFPLCDWAWDVGTIFIGLEYDVCFSDVASAGGVDQLDVTVGEAACHEEQLAVIDE